MPNPTEPDATNNSPSGLDPRGGVVREEGEILCYVNSAADDGPAVRTTKYPDEKYTDFYG